MDSTSGVYSSFIKPDALDVQEGLARLNAHDAGNPAFWMPLRHNQGAGPDGAASTYRAVVDIGPSGGHFRMVDEVGQEVSHATKD
jgi:hypothetical protein